MTIFVKYIDYLIFELFHVVVDDHPTALIGMSFLGNC